MKGQGQCRDLSTAKEEILFIKKEKIDIEGGRRKRGDGDGRGDNSGRRGPGQGLGQPKRDSIRIKLQNGANDNHESSQGGQGRGAGKSGAHGLAGRSNEAKNSWENLLKKKIIHEKWEAISKGRKGERAAHPDSPRTMILSRILRRDMLRSCKKRAQRERREEWWPRKGRAEAKEGEDREGS